MNAASRAKLVRASAVLQARYSAARAQLTADSERLASAGAFVAPPHLVPGLRAEFTFSGAHIEGLAAETVGVILPRRAARPRTPAVAAEQPGLPFGEIGAAENASR